jgi:hypothetical protein
MLKTIVTFYSFIIWIYITRAFEKYKVLWKV